MTDTAALIARVRELLAGFDGRCLRCCWPLAERREDGCVPGNCSYRPLPRDRFEPVRVHVLAEDLAQLADALEAAEAALTASRERERRLREALEHFARAADECREDAVLHMVSASRLRFARAALAAADGETGGGT